MFFNEDTRQWELTIEEVKENFEIPFKDDGVLLKRIKKNSRRIYRYIYRMINSYNIAVVERLINKTEGGKRFIYDCLISQMEADLATGFNSLADQPQIDLKTGRVIKSKDMMEDALISSETKLVIENSKMYFDGINIMSSVPFRGIR